MEYQSELRGVGDVPEVPDGPCDMVTQDRQCYTRREGKNYYIYIFHFIVKLIFLMLRTNNGFRFLVVSVFGGALKQGSFT